MEPVPASTVRAGSNGLATPRAEEGVSWKQGLLRAARLGHHIQRIPLSAPGQPVQPAVLPAVQRWPRIQDAGKTTAEPSRHEIEGFLSRHGAEVSILFESVLTGIEGTFEGEEGARQLAEAVHQGQAGLIGKIDLRQKAIMNKLGAIAQLVVRARGGLEKEKQEAIDLCSHLDNDQGLCFGFTEIFKRHARWEAALWKALARWVPEPGTPEKMLAALNRHLETTIRWAWGEEEDRAGEALLLLKEAWGFMRQENEAGYPDLPGWLKGVEGTPSKTKLVKIGQVTHLVHVPEVEQEHALKRRAQEVVDGKDEERRSALLPKLEPAIEDASAWLDDLGGLFELESEVAKQKILKEAPEQFAKLAVTLYTVGAKRSQEPAVKLKALRTQLRRRIASQVTNRAFETCYGARKSEEVEKLTAEMAARQAYLRNQAFRAFGAWLIGAGSLIDQALAASSRGEVMVEISTAGHSMAARRTPRRVELLEPENLGVGTYGSWSELVPALWEGLQVGAGSAEEMERGIALDMEVSDVQAVGGEVLASGQAVNIMSSLETDSVSAFSKLASTDGPAEFLKEVNPELFGKVTFRE